MDGDKKLQNKGDDQVEGGWQYKSDAPASNFAQAAEAPVGPLPQDPGGGIEWTASEFVASDKGAGWYLSLALVAVLVAGALYLITRDMISVVVVIFMAVSLAFASARKPKVINYRVDESGMTAGNKFYPYRAYKSFVMPDDGPFASIVLVPLKRFDLPVSAYLAPDNENEVLETVSRHLPMERGQLDTLDQLMRSLRF